MFNLNKKEVKTEIVSIFITELFKLLSFRIGTGKRCKTNTSADVYMQEKKEKIVQP